MPWIFSASSMARQRVAGLPDSKIKDAFLRFEPLPHRMQTVGTFCGVTWIDDSKATSLAALMAGVTMATARDDPDMVRTYLARDVRKVYLIGQCASLWAQVWKEAVSCEVCETLERAVESAMHDAEKGDCILLSPGAASFDQFKSYGERGDRFAALAKTWGQTLTVGNEGAGEGTRRGG